MTELQQEAAAALTADILSDFGVTPAGDEAPVAQGEPQKPAAAATEQETEEPSAEDKAEADVFDPAVWNPEVPEEYATPDFEEEAAAELAADDEEEPETENEYDDPALQDERKKRLAAEKKAAHYEQLQATERRKSWHAEAKRIAPFSEPFLEEITSTSRRGFIREARKYHDRVYAKVGPILQQLAEQKREEVKADAKAAWGQPTTGPGAPAAAAAGALSRIEKVRKQGDLAATIKAMFQEGYQI